MFNFVLFGLFTFGLFVGSFLNVCIYRIPVGKSIVLPNSYCYKCGTFIKWYDNVPLLSYILLRGRCRSCGERISPRYFVVELLTGILLALTFYKYGYSGATPFYIVVICFLIIATFTDIDHWIIPDSISVGSLGFALAGSLLIAPWTPQMIISQVGPFPMGRFYHPFFNALIGAAIGFVLLYLISIAGAVLFKKEAMGGGDVKLFALVGAVLGWWQLFYALALSSLIGAVTGVTVLYMRKSLRKKAAHQVNPAANQPAPIEEEDQTLQKILQDLDKQRPAPSLSSPIPFGPFIAVATVILIIFQPELERLILSYLTLY